MRRYDVSELDRRVVGDVLREQAEHLADETFLMFGDRHYSYGEANERANAYANGLRDLKVAPGDTVALMMDNSADFVFAALGANKLGAVWVPTNVSYRGDWLRHALVDSGARVLLTEAAYLPRLADVSDDLAFEHVLVRGDADVESRSGLGRPGRVEALEAGSTADPGVSVDPRSPSAVMWTSGTTGRSKGVVQSHSCWLWSSDIFNTARDLQAGDVFYCCLPMFNSGGWSLNVFGALTSGLPIGIDRSFSVTDFWNRTRAYGATQVVTLGTMHMYLWQQEAQEDDADNPLRVAALVPVPPQMVEPFKERFGIDYVWSAFGQSEVMPWSVTRRDRPAKPGSAGFLREDLDVALLDERDEPVATGAVGEVCVRPKRPYTIFSGYWNRPADTLRAFENLWYHSGDLGRLDEDGELFFVDRKADYLRYKGRNISSFEIEQVVGGHEAVAAVAATGVVSEELDQEEELKITVVLRSDVELSHADLARWINDRAPYYMVPRYIEFVAGLPMTPTGKLQKHKVRAEGLTPGTWDRVTAGFQVER